MSAPPLRVMLVDDHEVVRDGIRLLLNEATDVVLCAEASSAREAVATAARALPDVIVMDVRLQDGSGIEATRDIRAEAAAYLARHTTLPGA
jgi:two-component system, NarL family, response regulator DevR